MDLCFCSIASAPEATAALLPGVCKPACTHTHTSLIWFPFLWFSLKHFCPMDSSHCPRKGNVSMGGETVVVLFGAQLLFLASKPMTCTIDLLTKKKFAWAVFGEFFGDTWGAPIDHCIMIDCENLSCPTESWCIFSHHLHFHSVTSDVHVGDSSFASFDFLDGSGVDGLSGFPRGVDDNHSLELSRQVDSLLFNGFSELWSSSWFRLSVCLSVCLFPDRRIPVKKLPLQKTCAGLQYNSCLLNARPVMITVCILPYKSSMHLWTSWHFIPLMEERLNIPFACNQLLPMGLGDLQFLGIIGFQRRSDRDIWFWIA